MSAFEAAVTVALIALMTLFTRAAPFVLFPNAKKTPPFVKYLGGVLPHAMMGMLVVYCLKNVQITTGTHGLPEGIAILAAGLMHLWKRSMILSIASATALYMVLIQTVFR